MRRRFALLGTGLLVAMAILVPGAKASGPARARDGVLPAAPATGKTTNNDAEPAVAAAPDGSLWATAFTLSDPPSGQDIWTSDDGGSSWRWVAAPFNVPANKPLLGGDDADIAVASAPNPSGHYNIYVAGLWVTLSNSGLLVGDISLAVSVDGGRSWIVDPLAAEVPGDDRPWLAADGACTVHLVYHALPTVATVMNTYDLCNPVGTAAGLTLTPVASTRYASLAVPLLLGEKGLYVLVGFGKVVVDDSPRSRFRHRIYIPEMDCPGLTLNQEVQRAVALSGDCPNGEPAEVFVAVGTARGNAWTEVPVARSDDSAVPVWPATIATDATGRVYLVWHDNRNAFLDVSADGGRTWSPPEQLNVGLGSAVYPTVTASRNGVVDVAWYGADRPGDANDASVMGQPGAAGAAGWSVWVARSDDAGRTFLRSVADPLVHVGELCTKGDACSAANSRDLFDDFGATTSPTTGAVTVVYTSDQPGINPSSDAVHWATLPAG